MTTETMTIHKALAELKIIGDRIDDSISSGIFIKPNKHSNEKINGIPLDEFKKQIQGNWDKPVDLIMRRNAIKRAVILSNAITKRKLGDREYTIAEIIDMGNTDMIYKEKLLNTLKKQYADAIKIAEKENETLQQKAENYVIGLFGNKDGKLNIEEIENTKKQFIINNTYELIDVIKIREKIDSLEKEINEFKAEVDACKSASNALTEITIEY